MLEAAVTFHPLSAFQNHLNRKESQTTLITTRFSSYPFAQFPSTASMDSYHYYSTSFFYFSQNEHNTPHHPSSTILIPIETPSSGDLPTPVPVRLPDAVLNAAAVKIQSAFRRLLVRSLVGKIRAVDAEAGRMEQLIQRQETVDAVRRDERERLRVSEGLMALLLQLDSVPGFYPAVRQLRRSVSRRIVGLQEVLDAILGAPAVGGEGFPASLEDIVEGIWRGEERWAEEEEMWTAGNWERGFGCLEKLLGV